MRYHKANGEEFLENGNSKLRVGKVSEFPSPVSPARVVKVFEVRQVISNTNIRPIERGMLLALSFPSEKVNASEYEWYRGERWEECQVPLQVAMPTWMGYKKDHVHRLQ